MNNTISLQSLQYIKVPYWLKKYVEIDSGQTAEFLIKK